MFYRIKENALYDYADINYADDCLETDIITQSELDLHPNKVIVQNGVLVLNPNYEQEKAQRREDEFNAQFFNTSLGYIRRSVNMADGSRKDFLSDLLPTIAIGVSTGQAVNIIAYDEPPFDEDIEDWTPYQHIEVVTQQFIQECFQQLSNDFLPINEGEQ